MLPKSPVSASFWQDVGKKIAQLSDSGYDLSNTKIRFEENSKATNQVTLFCNVCIHKSKINDKNPSLFHLQNLPEDMHLGKCKARLKNEECSFKKEWSLLYNIWS